MIRSNHSLQMTDTRRLSPQTTSSSGYHSDLSSANQSPQSIHDNIEQSEKKLNKSFSRLSSFLHKQYEKVKVKLISSRQSSPPVTTCSKATSTTPLSYLPENNQRQSQQQQQPSSSCVYKRSSFIEPVYSIYVQPLYDNQVRIPLKNSTSIHECFPHQPIHRLSSYSTTNNSQNNSHSYRRLVSLSNYDNISTGYISTNSNYYVKPRVSQSYYPYKYLSKHYNSTQHTYAPLSDFISSKHSAFKPIHMSRRPVNHISEPITDPCDLEVAQYFHQTPQWSNPNYFDIYTKDKLVVRSRKNYSETLC